MLNFPNYNPSDYLDISFSDVPGYKPITVSYYNLGYGLAINPSYVPDYDPDTTPNPYTGLE